MTIFHPAARWAGQAAALAIVAMASAAQAAPDPRLSTDGSDPATWDPKLEATVSAPANHNVLYEDERIRIIRVTVPAGTREPVHMHRYCSVLVLDHVPLKIKDYDINGNENKGLPPYNHISSPLIAVQQPNAPHYLANNDTTPIQLVRIEFKQQKGPCAWDAPDIERGKTPNLSTLK